MTEWASNWKGSKDMRKQRKYRYNAPLHIQQKLVNVHLSPDLRKKYGKRSTGVRKEDKVKVLRGQFKGKTGKVMKVNLKKQRIDVEGIENIRKEGTKAPYPLQPSNLMITELYLDDKKRKELLERKGKTVEKKPVKESKE